VLFISRFNIPLGAEPKRVKAENIKRALRQLFEIRLPDFIFRKRKSFIISQFLKIIFRITVLRII
jgi:hypothetical protein